MVGLVVASVVQIDIDQLDPHEGAVAFTEPEFSTGLIVQKSGVGLVAFNDLQFGLGDVTSMAINASFPLSKYVGPGPVKKSILDAILNPATTFVPPVVGTDPVLGGGGGVTCGATTTKESEVVVSIYMAGTFTGPHGHVSNFSTDPVPMKVTVKRATADCSDGPHVTINAVGQTLTFRPGVYYFTQGFGDYLANVKVLRVGELGSTDVVSGSLEKMVSVDAGRLGP